jgi:predicted porin
MKKILFGTTALLAAASFSASAQAADPIKLSVGGFMNYYMVAADQDGDYAGNVNSFDVQGNSEIHFVGETTLDNGMTVGLQVELEAGSNHNSDDTIDESFMYFSGKYGKVFLGSDDDASYKSQVLAPSVSVLGVVGDGSDLVNVLPYAVNQVLVGQNITGDENKVTYFTPRMYGLQAAVSYIPSNNSGGDDAWSGVNNSETVAKATTTDEAWSFGLNYTADYSGVGVKASAGYVNADDNTRGVDDNKDNNVQEITGGLNVSYQGFTVGGGVARVIANEDTAYAANDGFGWHVGASYAEGPYAVSMAYYTSNATGSRTVAQDDELDVFQVAGTYKLGAGVDLFAELGYVNGDKEGDNNASAGNEGAVGGVVGLALSF